MCNYRARRKCLTNAIVWYPRRSKSNSGSFISVTQYLLLEQHTQKTPARVTTPALISMANSSPQHKVPPPSRRMFTVYSERLKNLPVDTRSVSSSSSESHSMSLAAARAAKVESIDLLRLLGFLLLEHCHPCESARRGKYVNRTSLTLRALAIGSPHLAQRNNAIAKSQKL